MFSHSSFAGEGEVQSAPEPRGRHAQQPPPASAQPSSREQPRRARAPTAGVVMAAAPSLTATFLPCPLRASWRTERSSLLAVARHRRAPTLTSAAPRPQSPPGLRAELGYGRHLNRLYSPRPLQPVRECCAFSVAPLLAGGWKEVGSWERCGEGGRGSSKENSKLRTDGRTFPPRMLKQKLPNPALEN